MGSGNIDSVVKKISCAGPSKPTGSFAIAGPAKGEGACEKAQPPLEAVAPILNVVTVLTPATT